MSAKADPYIEDASDRCVMCGMCIPQCPTYQLYRSENESPRGRIALLRAHNQGLLKADGALLNSINHCLYCGACEGICPATVPYLTLMDKGRERLWPSQPIFWRLKQRLLFWLTDSPRRFYYLMRIASFTLPWHWLVRFQGKRLIIDPVPGPITATRGKVVLLQGCANAALDPALHSASQRILQTLGFEVLKLPQEACCGALAQHSGAHDTAIHQAVRNLQQLPDTVLQAILHPASACSKQLQAYDQLLGASNKLRFAELSEDISQFILRQDWPAAWPFKQQSLRVLLHIPCSQREQGDALHAFLAGLPGLHVDRLSSGTGCCGAAGSYMLNYPATAQQLREKILAEGDRYQDYDYLVSGNIGCQLHLQQGLADLKVIHPLMLLYLHSDF